MSSISGPQEVPNVLATSQSARAIENQSTLNKGRLVRSVSNSSLKILGFKGVSSETVRRIPHSINTGHFPFDELRQKATEQMVNDIGRRPAISVNRDKIMSLNQQANLQLSLQKFEEISNRRSPPSKSDKSISSDGVPRPRTRHDLIKENLQKWMASHSPECRKAVAALINTIRYVPHAEFEKNFIERTIVHLNLLLQKENFDYVTPMQAKKSNQWMYELAQAHLVKRPSAITSLVYIDYLNGLLGRAQPQEFPSNIVFFDDAIFSAAQMTENIGRILGHIKRKNQSLPPEALIPIPRFVIACPYMTKFGKERLEDLFERYGLKDKVIILAHISISTIEESITDDNIKKMLTQMYWSKQTEIINDRGPKSRGVVYFDHKVPDGYSFPKAVAKGLVYDSRGCGRGGKYELIPPIESPYS